MTGTKTKWEDPKMLELNALPEALGHCVSGSTATSTGSAISACQTGGIPTGCAAGQAAVESCTNGQNTSAAGGGHNCSNGGVAGGISGQCTSGASVGP
jgi:hypothetical protein